MNTTDLANVSQSAAPFGVVPVVEPLGSGSETAGGVDLEGVVETSSWSTVVTPKS